MLNQRLQQKLLQKLSPQQIQLIKLLELPTLQLEQRIKKELEENPTLEEGSEITQEEQNDDSADDDTSDSADDEFSIEDYIEDDEIPNYKLAENNYSKDDKQIDMPYAGGISFREYLLTQVGLRWISDEEEVLAKYLIGNLDEDGYLRRDLDAIIDDLAFTLNINTGYEQIRKALDIVQGLEPIGVGARDLQECLLLQIKAKDQSHPDIHIAHQILKHHFEEFTKKHYDKIEKRLNITEEELKDAFEEIIRLNPRPGGVYSDNQSKSSQHVIPDFILEVVDGELQLSLNQRNVPELRVSRNYADMLRDISQNKKKTKQEKDTLTYVKQKLDSAKWFIDAIQQRQATLLSTMNEIILYQEAYFLEGDETKLRPMILKDIAERTQLDISTISRVANSKYIQTHFGTHPLKYFFSEGLMTDSGEEVSTREIKKILQDCIDGESKKKPLTDDKLAAILNDKGYQIARRTVAKYREQLDIPVARLRKEL